MLDVLRRYKDRLLSLGSNDYVWIRWSETENMLKKHPDAIKLFEYDINRQLEYEKSTQCQV